jgi:ABC-type antimicrobial peptide transport system permease subunit
VGILSGLVVYFAITVLVEWPFVFSPGSILVSSLFAAMVGIFFGYYPSRKASDLKPIEALKYE